MTAVLLAVVLLAVLAAVLLAGFVLGRCWLRLLEGAEFGARCGRLHPGWWWGRLVLGVDWAERWWWEVRRPSRETPPLLPPAVALPESWCDGGTPATRGPVVPHGATTITGGIDGYETETQGERT